MTHEDLRTAAVRWLTNTRRCSVVLSELVSAAGEIPDAIGWKYGMSCVVECKASRSDFYANANKPHSRSGSGLGRHRFFLCQPSIIVADDLLEMDYGLLWIKDSGQIRVVREALDRDTNATKEICMLTSALRRVRTREFLTINILADAEVTA